MGWGRMDDRMWRNPKVLSFSDKAFRLWVTSISYGNSAESRPHGFLTDGQVAMLVGTARATRRTVDELVDKRGWDKVEGGYLVHDLTDYVKRDETAAERQQRHRENVRREQEGRDEITPNVTANESENGVTSRVTVTPNVTVPLPVSRNPVPAEAKASELSPRGKRRTNPWSCWDDLTVAEQEEIVAYARHIDSRATESWVEMRVDSALNQVASQTWTKPMQGLQGAIRRAIVERHELDHLDRASRTNGHAQQPQRRESSLASFR